MRICLLGQLVVDVDGAGADVGRLGDLGRIALAYLVLERGRPVARDELADALWGEDLPPTWTSALRGVLSRVRSTLAATGLAADQVVRSELGCWRFCGPADLEVDLEQVAHAVAEAPGQLAASPVAVRRQLQEAVGLAAGQFLPGAGGQWVERRQAEVASLRVRALELLAGAASACCDHGAATAAAAEAVALAPLRESAHRALMAAYAAAGDRAAALRAYEECRVVLAEELGVAPSAATYDLYVRQLEDERPESVAAPPAPRLPEERTTFIGRQDHLEHLLELLAGVRLLTLTGPGGVGKSRLALRVAATVADRYPDRVYFVELAALADPSLVVPEVLSALDVAEVRGGAPADTLSQHLAGRAVLLVVDNCEHLVEACASLADDVLRKAGRVQMLATSREPLGVPGEVTWSVPSLDPADAVRLFAERVAVVAPDLDLERSKDAVDVICARLEGMPLAIELAAARARILSPAEIADRLDDHLRLLVGGPRAAPDRHRTLRAAVDWSFHGLSPAEQALFARLSVFAGGFGFDAAQAVAGDGEGDVLDDLESLVDKSLVAVDRGGARSRYRVLETLRQYGAERLAAGGGTAEMRRRHLRWAVALVEAEATDDATGLTLLDREHDNLRAALDFAARDGRVEEGLRLAAGLARFWEIRGYLGEGRSRLNAFAAAGGGPADLRARALNAAAVLAQRGGDFAAARTAYQEALVIQRARGDRVGVATGLHGLANLAVNDGDLVTASALFEENLAIAREVGNRRMQAASLMNLGVVAHAAFMRNLRPVEDAGPDAHRYYQESLVAYEELGDRYGQALALENLGTLTRLFPGDPAAARVLHERSLAVRRELGDRVGIADSARYIALLAVHTGEVATARRLHEERLVIERELGNVAHVAEALTDLGEIALMDGRLADAAAAFTEAEAIYEAANDGESLLRVLTGLGAVARLEGAYGRARAVLDRSLRLASDLDSRFGEGWALAQLARLARAENDPGRALALARDALLIAEDYHVSGVEAVVLDVVAAVAAGKGDMATAVRLAAAATRLGRASYRALEAEPIPDPAAMVAVLGRAGYQAAQAEGAAMTPAARRQLARSVTVA